MGKFLSRHLGDLIISGLFLVAFALVTSLVLYQKSIDANRQAPPEFSTLAECQTHAGRGESVRVLATEGKVILTCSGGRFEIFPWKNLEEKTLATCQTPPGAGRVVKVISVGEMTKRYYLACTSVPGKEIVIE